MRNIDEKEKERIAMRYCSEKITAHVLAKEENIPLSHMGVLLRKYLPIVQNKKPKNSI